MGFMKSMRKFAEILQTTRKTRDLLKSMASKTLKPEWADHKISEEALGLRRIEDS